MASGQKLQSIVQEIREFCQANADEKQVQKYARFFTEGYDAYGVPKETYFAQKEKLNEAYKDVLSLNDCIKLGGLLILSGKYEEASFAIGLLSPYHQQFKKTHFQKLGNWLEKGICNWGHTDVLCGEILEKFLLNGLVSTDDLSTWRQSKSKWKRRAVPVTMIGLVKKAKSAKETKTLLDFNEPLMHDEDRFVQQGLGWFLREAWKKQPTPVEALLLKHKDTAPRKIYQYATEKMTKEQKERFRAAKKKK